MEWDLNLYYYHQRGNLGVTTAESIELLKKLEAIAIEKKFALGKVVSQHFLHFEKYYAQQITHEVLYSHTLLEYDQMRQLGFEKFTNYFLVWILYNDGRFLYKLGDLETALEFFHTNEQFTKPTQEFAHNYILVMDHLQAIYDKKNNYKLALDYAYKIIDFTKSVRTIDPQWQTFYHNWHSLASGDIASILVKQGEFEESKIYAQKAYEFTKAKKNNNKANPNLEYEALQVLTSVMLELNELEEASPLLVRLDELYADVGDHYENYFNNIKYFECRALYHELKGEYETSIIFVKKAKPLKDSLLRRNDARSLEQLKQRVKAKEYAKRVEKERKDQRRLLYVTVIIFALSLFLMLLYFQKLYVQRRQRILELESAEKELARLTKNLQEKSIMLETSQKELEKLKDSYHHNNDLKTLTNSTILTKEDWLQFQRLFEEVHPGFIRDQKKRYSNITPAELRYLVLEKLHLNTKEMANMLGVTTSAVRKTKSRLNKKMEK
ncbi:MAG: hypothetical protein Sapg2KO_52730 [Saprospiraceae bacterium]